MKFYILTLFPEMVLNGLNTSIIGRAVEAGYLSIEAVNIRDFSNNKHSKVDDYPYGGGAGMLMQAQPVYDAWKSIVDRIGHRPRCIYLTPQGPTFHQEMAKELAGEEELILLCGHYEGIDERVLEEIVTDYMSIGDYVLTGGELGALVIIDAVSRLIPGVLGSDESSQDESFSSGLLEYPQYTRPREYRGLAVPDVLLSGDHAKISRWRRDRALELTWRRRPEMLKSVELDKKDRLFMQRLTENEPAQE